MNRVYLDYAAATPLDEDVQKAMEPYFSDRFYNPSAIYLSARDVRKDVESARHQVAIEIGAKLDEIVFTSGATESCNLAIKGVLDKFPEGEIIISTIEHEAVLKPAANYEHKYVKVNEQGVVDQAELKSTISDKTVLISIIYANNEIGVVQKLSDISQIISDVKKDRKTRGVELPIYLHTDAAQASNYLDLHVSRLGVDLMTLNGGKMYGPKQSGILYIRGGTVLSPQIEGGGQEWGLRSGTENIANIIGFSESLQKAQSIRRDEAHTLEQLRDTFVKQIRQKFSEILINGSMKKRLPNNINFSIPNLDGERIVMQMDEKGFEVATGAACSALSDESSHVLKALGRSESEAKGSIRISLGRSTTADSLDRFMATFEEVVKESA